MTKIGIVSDIHAYLEPLESALQLIERQQVEVILCAGDLIDGGPDGDAVVERLRTLEIPCVQGNHDRDVFLDQADLRKRMQATGETQHPMLLQSETVAYVSSLPLTRRFEIEGVTVCLAHGTPTDNNRYLFVGSDEHRFRSAVQDADADVLILGHTHDPMWVQVGETWVANPGSVSLNRFVDGAETRTCGILTLPDMQFDVFDLDRGNRHPVERRHIP